VHALVLGERCAATVLTATVNPHAENALRGLSAGTVAIVLGRMQDASKSRTIVASMVEVLNERSDDWRPPLPKPKKRRASILNDDWRRPNEIDWRKHPAFNEVSSLWNERPKATTSTQERPAVAPSRDAIKGCGKGELTARMERREREPRFPEGDTQQALMRIVLKEDRDALTRTATELIERNPAPSDNPEQQTQCEDWWAAAIRNYAYGRDRVYVDDVGRHILKKFKPGSFGKNELLRIGKVFFAMGWQRFRDRMGRGFVNPHRHHFSQ